MNLGEVIKITTADGLERIFPDGDIHLRAYGSFGAPPTNFITRQGYRQNGSTEVDYVLGVRSIDIEFYHETITDRATYWLKRAEIHELFRPNRNGQLLITLITPGNVKRSVYARASPGFTLPPSAPDGSIWNIDEVINFTVFDPIWFDPTTVEFDLSSVTFSDLVFPITFPIIFAPSGVQFTQTITYDGSWKSYPVITLTGPYDSVLIENSTTGVQIQLNIAIGPGEVRIINLMPGSQSIVDGSGTNKFSDLSPLSNLVDFNLRPDPEAPGGVQSFVVTFIGGTVNSSFEFTYNNRYFAI